MLNKSIKVQELDRVNMFIRAISAEMALSELRGFQDTRTNSIAVEMEEALYELRVRKLLISASIDSESRRARVTSH